MALPPLLLPLLLACFQSLPASGYPAELLPAPALVLRPRGSGRDEPLTLRCLAPITSSVTVYVFYRREEPRSPGTNFRNSSMAAVEDVAPLPGLYSCAYVALSARGSAWSRESPPSPFALPPGRRVPPATPSALPPEGAGAQAPRQHGIAGDRDSSRSASRRWYPGTSLAIFAGALGFLLPRGCC